MAGQAANILAGADLIPSFGLPALGHVHGSYRRTAWSAAPCRPWSAIPTAPPGVQVLAYVVVLIVLITAARLVNRATSAPGAPRFRFAHGKVPSE